MVQSTNKNDITSSNNSEQIEITSFGACDKKLSQDGTNNGVSCNTPNSSTECTKINMISGIDSLYYYIGFNLDNKEDLEARKFYNKLYSQMILNYDNSKTFGKNQTIQILGLNFTYVRRENGHYFFQDNKGLYTIGFKSLYVNKLLEPVCIELQYKGIYCLGIPNLIKLIDDTFNGYIGTYKSITRVDINVFVQYDFSNIKETNFATAKSHTKPFYYKGKLETIYVGKRPHQLRLYNKTKELKDKGGSKEPLLLEYFDTNGLDISKPIWNLEFQLNRAFLKARKILTVEDTLKNIDNLFDYSMKKIRLTDSGIDFTQTNKQRYKTSKIWEKIINSYHYNPIEQVTIPLEVAKAHKTEIDLNKIKNNIYKIIKKAYLNDIKIGIKQLANVLAQFLKDENIPSPEELGLKEYEYCEKTQTVLIHKQNIDIEEQVQIQFKNLIDYMQTNGYSLKIHDFKRLLQEYKDGK